MKKILMGNSLGHESVACLKTAIKLAADFSAQLYITHADEVADPTSLGRLFESLNLDVQEQYIESILKSNEEAINKQIKEVGGDSEKIQKICLTGDPALVLTKSALDLDVDLVVIGFNPEKGVSEKYLGGVTEGILHQCPRSVLIQKSKHFDDIKKIVVGYDFSEHCESALGWAKDLASKYQAEVHIVNIVPCFYEGYHAAHTLGSKLNSAMEKVIDESVAEVEANLSVKISSNHFKGINVVKKVIVDMDGSISDQLVRYTDEVSADLIILGSHKRGKVKDFILGGSVKKTLKKSSVSTLITK